MLCALGLLLCSAAFGVDALVRGVGPFSDVVIRAGADILCAMKPDTSARKKVEALERRKAMLDALIRFVKEHAEITSEAVIHALTGKTGLKFSEYALIVPNWKDGKAVLRLVKSGEDWINTMDADSYYGMERMIAEDVSNMSDSELEKLLDGIYREANPDDDESE